MTTGLVGMAAFAVSWHWLVTALAVLLWGIGSGGNWVLSSETMQRRIADGYLGRASSLDSFASVLAMSASVLGAALLIDNTDSIALGTLPWIALAAGIWLYLSARVNGNRSSNKRHLPLNPDRASAIAPG